MKELFIKYNYLIFSFEQIIENIYQTKKEEIAKNIYKGYIINLKDYEEFKEFINYGKVKSFYSSQKIETQKILQYFDINKFKKIKKFNSIEFNSPRFLFYKLGSKESFIIITEQIWKLLGNNNKEKIPNIEYTIDKNNHICIIFENGEKIFIRTDNNIINEYSLNYSNKAEEYKYYIDEYKNIIKDINSYYNNEKTFSNNLKKKEINMAPKSDYLISLSWVNNWKRITNYERIKFLIESNNSKDKILSDEVISHLEKNNFKYNELPPLEIFHFETKKELDDFLIKDSLVIIDSNFIQSFKIKDNKNITIYNLNKNQIQINSNKEMTYNIYKNIISTKKNLNLICLKKIFQIIKFTPSNPNIYLINKNILDDCKNIFEFNNGNRILFNNNISYENDFEKYFSQILKIIKDDEEYMNKIENINFLDEFKIIKNNDHKLYLKHNEIKLASNETISFDYPYNFSLVNEEVLLFLKENDIININMKEYFYQVNYIFKDGKILIILKENDKKNLYIIGHLNHDGNFINEYIIKEENNKEGVICFICNMYGINVLIDKFLKEENKNQIKNKEELIGYFMKIENNEIKIDENQSNININNPINNVVNNDDALKKENENFIIKIVSILISLYTLEKEIKKRLNDNKSINNNQNENSNYYLIKSNFIFQLKTLCEYGQIEQYLNKSNEQNLNEILNNKVYINSILSNKNEINSLFTIDNYKLKKTNIESYFYLNDFYILNADLFLKLKELNNNIDNIQSNEINLGINCGNIIFNLKNKPNNNYYNFIYSLKQDFSEIMNYKIHSLLIYSNIKDMNNHLFKLIKEENLSNYLMTINSNISNVKYILIEKNVSKGNNNVQNEDFYILSDIILYNEYSIVGQQNEKLYLINREFMKEIESNLFFNVIKQILLNNNQINTQNIYNNNKDEKTMIVKAVKNLLSDNLTQEIKNIKKDYIKSKLNLHQTLDIQNYFRENQNIFYFNKCQVITETICSLIKKFVPNINIDKKCFINKSKNIFSRLNEETLCLGDLSPNNIFQVKYIIYSKDISYLDNLMKNLMKSEIISIENASFPPQVRIIPIDSNKNDNNNNRIINNENLNKNVILSNKLISLIYLAYFSQKKLLEKNNATIRVALLNKKWLYQHHYVEISHLINKANIQLKPTNINDIISKLDSNILTKIDQNLVNISSLDESILAEFEIYQLKDKQIKVFKEFVLVNFDDFKNFIKNFYGNNNVNFDNDEQIGYINKQNEDIIFIVTKRNEQEYNYYLFIGKYNDINNNYDIQFILDYKSIEVLKEQKNLIINSDLNTYFNNNIIFNSNDSNDLLSPIIYNNLIIGTCYKCISNMNNFSKCRDYIELLKKNIFQYSVQLYNNYTKIFSNLNSNNSNLKKEEYFLVNRAFLSRIRQELNFIEFCSFLKNGGVFNNSPINVFNTINLLKNSDMETLKKYFSKEVNNFENFYSLLEIGIIPIKYYDNNIEKYIMIYNDFEIVDKQIIELFVDINRIKNYLVKCIINEGKIMVLLSSEFDQEKKGITIIGKIGNELNFVIEYILVYDNSEIRKQHTEYLYGNLNQFISDFQFVNHCQPIHDNKYKIVGTVIDYAQYDNTKNINTPVNISIFNTPNIQPIPNTNKNAINPNITQPFNPIIDIPPGKDKDDIKATFIYPTLIGLENIGATCYMNATLQCFCHIDKFVNFFKYNKQANNIYNNKMENTLSYSFKVLIEKLWPEGPNSKSKKFYAPYDFKEKISKMNPLFEGIQANDSKDLVNFIIMTLHDELNKANPLNISNNNINIDQRNKDLVFNSFIQNFTEDNKSIISDLFYGVYYTITQCQNCKTISFNYQIYFFLIFPLEEVRKFKLQYNPNNNEMLNIYDCFQFNQKIDLMFGGNAMYCNYCKQTFNATMSQILTVSPEILILILNRGKGIEFKIKLNFFEDLNLENFVEHKETGCKYKLIGVITHLGESSMSGHFIAYCKDPISKDWYQFNDANVKPVQDFQNEVINYAMPYLLFYQKVQQ